MICVVRLLVNKLLSESLPAFLSLPLSLSLQFIVVSVIRNPASYSTLSIR